MKKYDLCVKSGTYTDRNGNEKVNWENIGVMVDDGSPYILLKPYINLAGFPREEGRNYLIVSLFDHSAQSPAQTHRRAKSLYRSNHGQVHR